MSEEKPKTELPSADTEQTTFKMSSALFVFYVIVVIVAAGATGFFGNLGVFAAAAVIAAIVLIMLLLRFMFTSVTVAENGVDYRMGWLNTTLTQIPYDKINTVDAFVSLYGKILGYGTVKVFTGNDVKGIWFEGMENPHILCKMIEERVSAEDDGSGKVTIQPATSAADEIAKLDKLRDEGTITDAEFETEKKELLNR